jgi:hypothetical protein
MVRRPGSEEFQIWKVLEERPKASSRLFTIAVQEPAVGLGDDEDGGGPVSRRVREQHLGSSVLPISPDQKSDEDTRIEEDLSVHGRSRP